MSTDLVGLVSERVGKRPLDAVLRQLLPDPLGLQDTSWWVDAANWPRLAEAFDSNPLKVDMLTTCRQQVDPLGKRYFKGGAGLVSTAADSLRSCQRMVNGGGLDGKRYLSRKTVQLMVPNPTVGMAGSTTATTGPGYGFGLGYGVRRR